jgi:hypothetical protein
MCNGVCTSVIWDDENRGDCGKTCGVNQQCYDGKCECIDTFDTVNCPDGCFDKSQLASDPQHCGSCTNVCPVGTICTGGVCAVCPAGQVECGAGNCVSTTTNPSHCGACNVACDAAHQCVASKCVCKTGTTACGAVCVNLMSDKYNCGACGVSCVGNKTCQNGVCG